MTVKSKFRYPSMLLLLGELILSIVCYYKVHSWLSAIVPIVIFSVYIILLEFATARTLVFSKEGCLVRWLFFKRFYRWEELQFKRYIDLHEVRRLSSTRGSAQLPYLGGAECSVKKIKRSKTDSPSYYAALHWTLSYFYVYFITTECPDEKGLAYEYLVDETEFRAKLAEWGVEMDEPESK